MELRRFSTTLYKNKSASDLAQVPAGDATVDLFYQGGTVLDDTAIGASPGVATVGMFGIGALRVNDTVALNATDAPTFNVDTINSATEIVLRNNSASLVVISSGTRLRIINRQPLAYGDIRGFVSITPAPDANGLVEFYTVDRFFDYRVSGPGLVAKLYQEGLSGPVTEPPYLDITNRTGTIQEFLDAAPPGARIYFPSSAGPYMPPSAAGWILSRPVEIFGDGDTGLNEGKGFIFWNNGTAGSSKNSTIFTIRYDGTYATGQKMYIHDITFSQHIFPTDSTGTGDGIRFDQFTAGVQSIRIERVFIGYAGRSALRSINTADPTSSDLTTQAPFYLDEMVITGLQAFSPWGHGIFLSTANNVDVRYYNCGEGHRNGVWMSHCANAANLRFEIGNVGENNTDVNLEGYVTFYECSDLHIAGCNIEGVGYKTSGGPTVATTVKNGMVLVNCRGCVVEANEFGGAQNAFTVGTRAIYLYSTGTAGNDGYCAGNFIGVNAHADNEWTVLVHDHANVHFNTILPQVARTWDANGPCKVSDVGGRNFLFITDKFSSSRRAIGIRFPKVAGVAGIDASVIEDGLVVYDSTAGIFKGRHGGAWKDFNV